MGRRGSCSEVMCEGLKSIGSHSDELHKSIGRRRKTDGYPIETIDILWGGFKNEMYLMQEEKQQKVVYRKKGSRGTESFKYISSTSISTECQVPVRERDLVYQSGQDTTARRM